MIRKIRVSADLNATKQRQRRRWLFNGLMVVLAISVLTFLFVSLRSLFLPVLFGGLLAYLFRPLKSFLRVSWLPDPVRIGILFSGVIFGLFWATASLKTLVPNELQALELKIRMQYKFNEKIEELLNINAITGEGNGIYELVRNEVKPVLSHINELLALSPEESKNFVKYVNHSNKNLRPPLPYILYYQSNQRFLKLKKEIKSELEREPASIGAPPNEGAPAQNAALGGLWSTISTWLVMPLVFIFLLFDDGQVLRAFLKLIPNRYFEVSMMVVKEVDEAVGRYLRGTLMECSLVGLTLATGLFLIGVSLPVAIAIGAIAGLTNAIPFLGPFIGLVVGLVYALIAENIQPVLPFMGPEDLFMGVVVCVAITQVLDNVFFQPVVLGNAVNLHPLVVILGVVGGSISFGFSGMLLAIPAIVVSKTVIETLFKELKAYKII